MNADDGTARDGGGAVLLIDGLAGVAALHDGRRTIDRLTDAAAGGPIPGNDEGVPAAFPRAAALRLAERARREGIPLAGIALNDHAARFAPGLEWLPLHRADFSLHGGQAGAGETARSAAARFARDSLPPERPLHVLHLFHGEGGGPYELLRDLAGPLAACGIASSSVALREPDCVRTPLPELAARFVHPDEIARPAPSFDGFVNLRRYEEAALAAAARIHRANPVDLVHVHAHAALAAGAMRLLLGMPVVVTQHVNECAMERHTGRLEENYAYGTPELREQLADIFRRERETVTGARLVTAPSRAACAETLRLFPLPQERLAFVPNGLAAGAPRPGRLTDHVRRLAAGGPVAAFAGALTRVKGADRFFAAADLLLRRRRDLTVFAAGAAWTGHDDLARWLPAGETRERVHLLGRITRDETRELLAAADVVLCPSRYESFGLVALEAMRAGASPVVADTGGLPELVGGSGAGAVVRDLAPEAFAAAAEGMLSGDREARAARGRARADDYPVERTAARLAAVYARAVAEAAR